MQGKIKFYKKERGFGFILGDDGEDYFFHLSSIKSNISLEPNVIVEFDPIDGKKGKIAENIM